MAQQRVITRGGAQKAQPRRPFEYTELMQEHVQKQLNISDKQKETLDAIRKKEAELSRQDYAGLWNLSAEARRTRLAEVRENRRQRYDELQKAVEGVLTADQLEALMAIRVKSKSYLLLYNYSLPPNSGRTRPLGLSDEQAAKIRQIRVETYHKIREIEDQAATEMLNVLEPEQLEELKEIAARSSAGEGPG